MPVLLRYSSRNRDVMAEIENNKLVFASKNEGKTRELKALLSGMNVDLLSLQDYPDAPDIIEDGRTFLENALKKAQSISKYTGQTVIADDSGMEVESLGEKPGVHSARYSGKDATDEKNNEKLLTELKDIPIEKRDAAFRCALVLYRPDGS